MKYLFKQNEGFSHKRIRDVENIDNYDVNTYIVVDDSTYGDLTDLKLMWKDGQLVSNPNYDAYKAAEDRQIRTVNTQDRIESYKKLLAETDYRAIKYAEGLYTEEEYAPYKALRQGYRDSINALEKELENL